MLIKPIQEASVHAIGQLVNADLDVISNVPGLYNIVLRSNTSSVSDCSVRWSTDGGTWYTIKTVSPGEEWQYEGYLVYLRFESPASSTLNYYIDKRI